MYRISKKMAFAVEAVADIAAHCEDGPVQSREITQRQGIPERYLEQALQRLVRVGILKGVRGPRGGYRLARAAERISVGEIVAVIRGLEGGHDFREQDAGSDIGRRAIFPLFDSLGHEIMERLDRISITDILKMSEGQQRVDTHLRQVVNA